MLPKKLIQTFFISQRCFKKGKTSKQTSKRANKQASKNTHIYIYPPTVQLVVSYFISWSHSPKQIKKKKREKERERSQLIHSEPARRVLKSPRRGGFVSGDGDETGDSANEEGGGSERGVESSDS